MSQQFEKFYVKFELYILGLLLLLMKHKVVSSQVEAWVQVEEWVQVHIIQKK